MEFVEFALAIYPQQRRPGSVPYSRDRVNIEQDWGLLKLLLGTTYKQLEDDLTLLAAPHLLDVTTREPEFVKLYQCEEMRWDKNYPEVTRLIATINELGNMKNMCVECCAVSDGRAIVQHIRGHHSNVLRIVHTIKVNL